MTRRRLFLLALAVALVLLGATWALWPQASAITQENAQRIRPGMTRVEVETILGGPWHRESTAGQGDWVGPDCVIIVQFSDDDRVIFVLPQQLVREETLLQRMRRWIGL